MNNEELIADVRNYAIGLQASVLVRHTGAELIDKLCDALEAVTSTGYDYAGADYDGSPDSVGWRQWGGTLTRRSHGGAGVPQGSGSRTETGRAILFQNRACTIPNHGVQ